MSAPDHACDEPHSTKVCLVCHGDDPTPGRLPTTFVLGGTYETAKRWCRENGVRLYARSTVMARRGPVLRGYRVRPEDRIVILEPGPTAEVLRDLEIAQHEFRKQDLPEVEYVR